MTYKQPQLMEAGLPVYCKAETATGHVWWRAEGKRLYPLRPQNVELMPDGETGSKEQK